MISTEASEPLGTEADHGEIVAWAHEMRAWINLTTGDYNGVVAATRAGTGVTPHHSVAVQLFAQEAKAWARMGDRRRTEVPLDKGRRLLESLPYPENLDHHFVVDPTKFDFYAIKRDNTPLTESLDRASHLFRTDWSANSLYLRTFGYKVRLGRYGASVTHPALGVAALPHCM